MLLVCSARIKMQTILFLELSKCSEIQSKVPLSESPILLFRPRVLTLYLEPFYGEHTERILAV